MLTMSKFLQLNKKLLFIKQNKIFTKLKTKMVNSISMVGLPNVRSFKKMIECIEGWI
jgi:hypothetical protein